jgi:hypothetical protein
VKAFIPQKDPINFLYKILKKLLTSYRHHANIILPGSERLKGEPGSGQREKPEDNKGESLDWKPGLSKRNGQLKGTAAERKREG